MGDSKLSEWSPQVAYPAIADTGNREALYHYVASHLRNFQHATGTTSKAIDSRLQLRGCRGAHVADSSVFPNSITGHPDVPSRALGQIAAKYILEDKFPRRKVAMNLPS